MCQYHTILMNVGLCCQVASVVSDSLRPHGLQPSRLLRPWDFPGKSTGVGAIAFSGIYITMCKIDNQWKFAVGLRELQPGLYNNLEWWEGVGCGRQVQEGGDMYTYN